MNREYQYFRSAIAGYRLPLLLCDIDRLDRNVAALARRAGGKPIRLATKSVRCQVITARVLAHPGYRGLMCYTAREAAFLADHGFDDLLVAYPTVDAIELGELATRVAAGARITCMVDCEDHLAPLVTAAIAQHTRIRVAIDIDMSTRLPGFHFGVQRSPIFLIDQAVALARRIKKESRLALDGVMGYEAQIAGLPDAAGAKAAAIRLLKTFSRRELVRRRQSIVEALRNAGFPLRFVNGGGTGSIESTSDDASTTELTAGSGIYSPTLFDHYRGFQHEPSLMFALPVTRRPTDDVIVCHGGGYIASGPAGDDKAPAPHLPAGLELLPLEGAGEVQTPLRLDAGCEIKIGDPVFFRAAKAGEVLERFNRVHLISNGKVIGEVNTYRGEGECFL